MHIIITRPIEDCLDIISKFKILGHKITHLPLLYIKKVEHQKINFDNYKSVIFRCKKYTKKSFMFLCW